MTAQFHSSHNNSASLREAEKKHILFAVLSLQPLQTVVVKSWSCTPRLTDQGPLWCNLFSYTEMNRKWIGTEKKQYNSNVMYPLDLSYLINKNNVAFNLFGISSIDISLQTQSYTFRSSALSWLTVIRMLPHDAVSLNALHVGLSVHLTTVKWTILASLKDQSTERCCPNICLLRCFMLLRLQWDLDDGLIAHWQAVVYGQHQWLAF